MNSQKNKIALNNSNLSEKIEPGRLPFHQHTHIFCVSHPDTHTQKQTCNERVLYQALSPSFIKRQKIALCWDCQCRLPSQKPICFTCEHRILQGFADFKWQIVPEFALLWELCLFGFFGFCFVWLPTRGDHPQQTGIFVSHWAQPILLHLCTERSLCSWKCIQKALYPQKNLCARCNICG